MSRETPTIGVGVIVLDGDRVLLIKRGKPPREGQWSIPGGKQEWGETVRETARREVLEETGLEVSVGGLIDVVDLRVPGDGTDGDGSNASGGLSHHYTLVDFVAVPVGGDLRAGSDAADARWVPVDALDAYELWDETVRVIRAAVASRNDGGENDAAGSR